MGGSSWVSALGSSSGNWLARHRDSITCVWQHGHVHTARLTWPEQPQVHVSSAVEVLLRAQVGGVTRRLDLPMPPGEATRDGVLDRERPATLTDVWFSVR